MNALYEVLVRNSNFANILKVKCIRGEIESDSTEIIIPPIIEYNLAGEIRFIELDEILEEVKMSPYGDKVKHQERAADADVSGLYKHLEFFQKLITRINSNGELENHPVCEFINSYVIYLKPNEEAKKVISRLPFREQGKKLGKILEKVKENAESYLPYKLDLFSIPKRKVGSFAFIAGKDGYGKIPKTFSFGFHKAIPSDRIAREIGSLKTAEKFINQAKLPFKFPEELKPYVTMVRVAIVETEYDMLDGGDIFPSAREKLACVLSRANVITDLDSIEEDKLNLTAKAFKSGINIVHQEVVHYNELKSKPGSLRLIFPGGVKIAGAYVDGQAYDSNKKPIDIMIQDKTFANKGAVACFAMFDENNYDRGLDLDECYEILKNLKQEKVYLNGKEYVAYAGNLPVMRPGQRHLELSKPSESGVSHDIIANAILRRKTIVSRNIQTEYEDLVKYRKILEAEYKEQYQEESGEEYFAESYSY